MVCQFSVEGISSVIIQGEPFEEVVILLRWLVSYNKRTRSMYSCMDYSVRFGELNCRSIEVVNLLMSPLSTKGVHSL